MSSEQQTVHGCLTGQSQQQEVTIHSRGLEAASTTLTETRLRVHKLNTEDSVYAAKSGIRARQGDQVFAR